jgi:hypothetical protein
MSDHVIDAIDSAIRDYQTSPDAMRIPAPAEHHGDPGEDVLWSYDANQHHRPTDERRAELCDWVRAQGLDPDMIVRVEIRAGTPDTARVTSYVPDPEHGILAYADLGLEPRDEVIVADFTVPVDRLPPGVAA